MTVLNNSIRINASPFDVWAALACLDRLQQLEAASCTYAEVHHVFREKGVKSVLRS